MKIISFKYKITSYASKLSLSCFLGLFWHLVLSHVIFPIAPSGAVPHAAVHGVVAPPSRLQCAAWATFSMSRAPYPPPSPEDSMRVPWQRMATCVRQISITVAVFGINNRKSGMSGSF